MIVTVYVDASFHHGSKAMGWAAWIVYCPEGGEVERKFGSGHGTAKDSTEAELIAILEGIRIGAPLDGARMLVVKSDCQAAVHIARFRARAPRQPNLRQLQEQIKRLTETKEISRKVRWTKGHTGEGTPGYINNKVDAWAREQMRIKRQQLRYEEIGDYHYEDAEFYADCLGFDPHDMY